MAALVLEYYLVLRSVLRDKPHLRPCLTRCRHCGIFFLTRPCNARRRPRVGCPFGCCEGHRRRESTRRSGAYYRHPQGQRKKSALNQKRRAPSLQTTELEKLPKAPARKVPELEPPLIPWDELMIEYVRMASSLIEGRWVSRREVLEMLAKQMRQRSEPRRTQLDYTVAWLKKYPP